MENIHTEQPSSSRGHERKLQIQRRNLKIIGATALVAAASFLGFKTISKLGQPPRLSPAECTVAVQDGTIWNTAEAIAPNRDTRNVIQDINNTSGNETNYANTETGDEILLDAKLCESAKDNGVTTAPIR